LNRLAAPPLRGGAREYLSNTLLSNLILGVLVPL
ncbi:hypothetical protein SCARD494_12654, partial [Seiridium cardinale]